MQHLLSSAKEMFSKILTLLIFMLLLPDEWQFPLKNEPVRVAEGQAGVAVHKHPSPAR
jgi:hypothetical protein